MITCLVFYVPPVLSNIIIEYCACFLCNEQIEYNNHNCKGIISLISKIKYKLTEIQQSDDCIIVSFFNRNNEIGTLTLPTDPDNVCFLMDYKDEDMLEDEKEGEDEDSKIPCPICSNTSLEIIDVIFEPMEGDPFGIWYGGYLIKCYCGFSCRHVSNIEECGPPRTHSFGYILNVLEYYSRLV